MNTNFANAVLYSQYHKPLQRTKNVIQFVTIFNYRRLLAYLVTIGVFT